MSAREKILQAVEAAGIEQLPLPPAMHHATGMLDVVENFIGILQKTGSTVYRCTDEASAVKTVEAYLQQFANTIIALPGKPAAIDTDFFDLDAAALYATCGVAENGAVWIPENNMAHRLVPFATKELLVLIAEEDIVATMHEAYDTIHLSQTSYGVFIAGPSKTADIEQSLVIGAHGPLAHHVFLYKK